LEVTASHMVSSSGRADRAISVVIRQDICLLRQFGAVRHVIIMPNSLHECVARLASWHSDSEKWKIGLTFKIAHQTLIILCRWLPLLRSQ